MGIHQTVSTQTIDNDNIANNDQIAYPKRVCLQQLEKWVRKFSFLQIIISNLILLPAAPAASITDVPILISISTFNLHCFKLHLHQ